jgi:hypothetical protein
VDKLGMKKTAKVIHSLRRGYKWFDTRLPSAIKASRNKMLRYFSTEASKTITTSF